MLIYVIMKIMPLSCLAWRSDLNKILVPLEAENLGGPQNIGHARRLLSLVMSHFSYCPFVWTTES